MSKAARMTRRRRSVEPTDAKPRHMALRDFYLARWGITRTIKDVRSEPTPVGVTQEEK